MYLFSRFPSQFFFLCLLAATTCPTVSTFQVTPLIETQRYGSIFPIPRSTSSTLRKLQDNNNDNSNVPKELRVGPLGSLEALAIVTSLFFVATVFGTGDALFATPTGTTTPRPMVDAEQVLQQDFQRMETSVQFENEE